jgi:sugar lactone lactonase YvrE
MGYADGPGGTARFKDIAGITSDAAGNLYVADFGNRIIRKVATDGSVSTYAGVYGNVFVPTDGPALTARFAYPNGVAVDAAGVLWVDDGGTSLRRVSANRDPAP